MEDKGKGETGSLELEERKEEMVRSSAKHLMRTESEAFPS